MWHELKDFIRKQVKPMNENELVNGIVRFWNTVTLQKCQAYINHLKTVIPKVIVVNGEATGY